MKLVFYTVFVVTSIVIEKQHYFVFALNSERVSGSEDNSEVFTSEEHVYENEAALKQMLGLTFLALIDISFTDGSKRTCTGTIIHDNVVITAGHCFSKLYEKYIIPELGDSFVVIGSKKMFENGHEQYVPIERLVRHPKFRGWTADIALVHTFAGMVSEKTGTILPLAGDKLTTPDHANVTVLSWGLCNNNNLEEDSLANWRKRSRFPLRAKNIFSSDEEKLPSTPTSKKNQKTKLKTRFKKISNKSEEKQKRHKSYNSESHEKHRKTTEAPEYKNTAQLSSDEDTNSQQSFNADEVNYKQSQTRQITYESLLKNHRRSMNSDNNKLTVETFGFMNVQACKEMVKKTMPDKYKIKNTNEYVCYTSEDHYITDEDSGAPAVRHGHLVAVTVGGVESDGDHIAVGIKVSCFCSWIADNLPKKGKQLKCCDHCCDGAKPTAPSKQENVKGHGKKKKQRFTYL